MDTVFSILTTTGLIIAVILFFNLMIFVHELGHFWAGRWRGLYIDRFQIWFGKPLWKKTINGVQWGLGWIPAGGFVSLPQLAPMEAIEGKASIPENQKPITPVDKIIVAAAGPFFSLLLAIVFACIVWAVGKPSTNYTVTQVGYVPTESPAFIAGLRAGDQILEIDDHPVHKWIGNMEGVRERILLGENKMVKFLVQAPGEKSPRIVMSGFNIPETSWWQRKALRVVGISPAMKSIVKDVLPGSPAQVAGLQPQDEIIAVQGATAYSPLMIEEPLTKADSLEITVKRGNETLNLELKGAIPSNWQGKDGAEKISGIQWTETTEGIEKGLEHPSPLSQITMSLKWMGDTLTKIFAPDSDIGMQHLSGPVGIANSLYSMISTPQGWMLALWFAVVLNVNLAVLNILPLPVVDGGHIVLNTLELIFRRPISGRILEGIQTVFVLCLMLFFVFVTFKDVGDLFGKPKQEQLPVPNFTSK